MAVVSKTVLKTYFETGDIPTQSQFEDLIDSLTHVDDSIDVYGEFDDDSAAGTGGVPIGGYYRLSQANAYGIPTGNGGILKRREE